MGSIKENVLKIQEEIAPYKPNIIAVTKYFDENKIKEAYNAGLRDFGESRVLEAAEKIQKLPQEIKQNSTFHLIGHLQSNKVQKAVKLFGLIHSVDSLKLAGAISQEAVKEGKIQKILLQLNNAGEEQKFGFSKEELFAVFKRIKDLKGIKIEGLMNMAPLEIKGRELIGLFEDVVKTRDELEKKYCCKLNEISMGMSGDYKEASFAGATMIRVGRKLFGT